MGRVGRIMKICFIDTLGLTYDGSTLTKRGLGGSESAVIRMAEELSKLGFIVTVFNDCESDDSMPGLYGRVLYRPIRLVSTADYYDICIVSRTIKPIEEQWSVVEKAKHVILWMHDTFCEGDNQIEYLVNMGKINEIFTLSDWHTAYVTNCDHGYRRNFEILKHKIFQTRNGISILPEWIDIKAKDPHHFVFNSSVTKGMIPLVTKIWPRIHHFLPEAKLTVIGGYYKFREGAAPDQQEQDYRKLVAEYPEVNFTGIITQSEISDILRDATFLLYPSAFPETFGISTLEALAHNVVPITCRSGALEETALDIASYKMNYTVEKNWSVPWLNEEEQIEKFINLTFEAVNTPYLTQQKAYACNQVKDICTWDTVALQWKQHFYSVMGEFLPIEEYRKAQQINYKVCKTFGRRFRNLENLRIPSNNQKYIGIITAVYNAEEYIERCIRSVASQDYDNYLMYIVDDKSTDNTVAVAKQTIESLPHNLRNNFCVIQNEENKGAVANHYDVIKEYSLEEDFFIILDGDDWLVNDANIFHMYNNLYHDGAEFTYGSCYSVVDNIPLIAQPYPPEVKANKSYRKYLFNWNMPYTHLRTFSATLVEDLTEDDLKIGCYWPKAGGDTALFYYLIERADPDKVICVSDVVYNYNDANPINDYKINSIEQTTNASQILADKPSPFTPGQIDLRPL